MSSWLTIILIILSEIAIVEALYIWFFMPAKKASPKVNVSAAKEMYNKFLNDEERQPKLIQIFHENYEFEDDTAKIKADELIKFENALQKLLIQSVAKSDLDGIVPINQSVSEIIEHYRQSADEMKQSYVKQAEEQQEKIVGLEADREKLRNELSSTLETMDRTLNEYANMYSVKSHENEKEFQELQQTVNNTRQHADHTLKKSEDIDPGTATPKPVAESIPNSEKFEAKPSDQADIDALFEQNSDPVTENVSDTAAIEDDTSNQADIDALLDQNNNPTEPPQASIDNINPVADDNTEVASKSEEEYDINAGDESLNSIDTPNINLDDKVDEPPADIPELDDIVEEPNKANSG